MRIRKMTPADREAVAGLIHASTNAWYTSSGKPAVFRCDPRETALFFDVYHALPGSGGIVAVDDEAGTLLGSCFYHVRPTHVSLGIMNAHPEHFGEGVAVALLDNIIRLADKEKKPLRLVASAMNLDSFSLYTRRGFVPRAAYQDMYISVPPKGIEYPSTASDRVRPATLDDVGRIAELEMSVTHIQRESDYRHFIVNHEAIWHVSVIESPSKGTLDGVLASCAHPACNMIGPGVARTQEQAAALIVSELNHHRGRTPVFLVPVECTELVLDMYRLGARNCEIHFTQVRGHWPGLEGVNMPTFMPETG